MKLFYKIFTLFLCLILGSCSRTIVINNPEVMATNTRAIEIERIEISDTATVFYIDAYNRPGNWISIASETYLEGNVTGKQYKLIRSEGFELDKQINMPESGNVPFKLYFEPLDKKETAVEFVEGHNSGAFVISGIQLKEKEVKGNIKCHISGTVIDRPQSSRLMLMPWNSDTRVYPWISIPIQDGKFDYTFHVDVEEAYDLIFYDERIQGGWRPISFFAENGDITFTLFPMDKWKENHISTNAPLNVLSKAYKEIEKTLSSEFDFSSISEEMDKLWNENRLFSDEHKKLQEDINKATPEERDKLYRLQNELQKNGTLVELKDREKIWQKYGVGNGGGGTFLVDKTGVILAVNPTAEQVAVILEKQL